MPTALIFGTSRGLGRALVAVWRDNLDQKARQSGSEPVIAMLLLCSSRLSLASVMFGVDCRGATALPRLICSRRWGRCLI